VTEGRKVAEGRKEGRKVHISKFLAALGALVVFHDLKEWRKTKEGNEGRKEGSEGRKCRK
jgi:hypothetical protein